MKLGDERIAFCNNVAYSRAELRLQAVNPQKRFENYPGKAYNVWR